MSLKQLEKQECTLHFYQLCEIASFYIDESKKKFFFSFSCYNFSNKIFSDKSLGEIQYNCNTIHCLQMPIQTLTESLPVQSKHQGIVYL